jgi:preprotein translocase subunit SecA
MLCGMTGTALTSQEFYSVYKLDVILYRHTTRLNVSITMTSFSNERTKIEAIIRKVRKYMKNNLCSWYASIDKMKCSVWSFLKQVLRDAQCENHEREGEITQMRA